GSLTPSGAPYPPYNGAGFFQRDTSVAQTTRAAIDPKRSIIDRSWCSLCLCAFVRVISGFKFIG
ncbi:MAG: hypothetical protein JZU52_20745, partial [Lamprocystis purpurea]|nr:hypothetical protein [Lamprocystis purpurea]